MANQMLPGASKKLASVFYRLAGAFQVLAGPFLWMIWLPGYRPRPSRDWLGPLRSWLVLPKCLLRPSRGCVGPSWGYYFSRMLAQGEWMDGCTNYLGFSTELRPFQIHCLKKQKSETTDVLFLFAVPSSHPHSTPGGVESKLRVETPAGLCPIVWHPPNMFPSSSFALPRRRFLRKSFFATSTESE